MPYTVQKVGDVSLVGDTLVSLWTRNLNMRSDPRFKYEWYYVGNPLQPADAFVLNQQAGSGPAEVVGCCGVGARLVSVNGRQLRAGLFADFAVDKAHRTVMPALVLQRALCGHVTSAYDFGYGFPNGAAVGIFARIGFPLLGQMGRFVKVLRYSHFVRRRVPGFVAAIAGPVLDAYFGGRDRLGSRSGGTLRWVEDVDDRFDRLWEGARARYSIIGERTARFLRWRFLTRPGLRGRIAVLEDAAGALRAYAAVVEKDEGVALIADFLAASDQDLRMLLRRLSPELRRRGYHSAVTLFLGNAATSELLKAEGFQLRNLGKFVVVGMASSSDAPRTEPGAAVEPAAPALNLEQLRNTEAWYLTEADRDN